MGNQVYFVNKLNQENIIKLVKISIIGLFSFSLLSSTIPFFLGYDDVNYGIASINLSKGDLTITNELLEDTGDSDFVPRSFVLTNEKNSAVPKNNIGILALGSISYLVGGFYGLIYLGPIFTILLLIVFERLTSKFFGNMVGLLALMLLAADWQFYFIGLRFLTDNIFSLFFILGVFSIIKFLQSKNAKYILLCSTFFVAATFLRINGVVFFTTELLIILGFYIVQYMKGSKIFIKNNKGKSFQENTNNNFFSNTNLKKFLKLGIMFLIPWLIFITFWFSYNDYFFGDAVTNYREQIQSGSIIEEETIQDPVELSSAIKSNDIILNEFKRLNLIQYFSVPLLPDPLYFFLIITSETDLNEWRSDTWISFIIFLVLLLSIIFSLFFKIKRKEIITLVLFIITVVGFYSSPLGSPSSQAENLSENANNRYVLSATLLSFIILGFILVEAWRKFFNVNYKWNEKRIRRSIKIIYLYLIVIFFSALLVVMPSIQDQYQQGFHFNNPIIFEESFNNLEKLPEKSLIVGYEGRNTLLHTDTYFNPYIKKFIEDPGIDTLSASKLQTLKDILNNGYSAYTFKNNMHPIDAKYFQLLELHYGIILKDYSDTFCKLELLDNTDKNKNNISDLNCFKDVKEKREKIWPTTLRWSL